MTDRLRLAAQTFLDCHDAFVMKQSREVAYAMRDAADDLRAAIVHDIETKPYSSWASELACMRENVEGTAALLREAEKERDALKARITAYEAAMNDVIDDHDDVYNYTCRRLNRALDGQPGEGAP